jgi:HlyD family secretion protein
MRKFVILLLIVLAAGGGLYYVKYLRAEDPPSFRTEVVERGDLFLTIGATGTVEPEEIVDVGAQVVGRIKEFGLDPRSETDPDYKDKRIDYGSPVKKDWILAQIDPALYLATYNQSKAGLERAEADLEQLKARYVQTTAEWNRAQKLRELKLPSISGFGSGTGGSNAQTTIKGISDSDFVLAKANYEVAKANVDVGASVVEQQKALLYSAKTNLEYTTIKSPVDGMIITRRVNIGQTVVSSLNAPSLFLIAKDLKRLEVWAAVNEADIGQLRVDMPVHFEVAAFPGEVFRGVVRQIRLDAQTTNNVVIYTVAVSTNNDNLRLLPYLSAELKFEVDERLGVLKVPNSAMRYRPRQELVIPPPAGVETELPASENDQDNHENIRTLWVRHGNFVYPVDVRIGLTDGAESEIIAGAVTEGTELVVGENLAGALPTEGTNPFAPPRFRGKKKDAKKST